MAKLRQIRIKNFNYKRPSGLCNVCGKDDKPVVEVAVEIGEIKSLSICDECAQDVCSFFRQF